MRFERCLDRVATVVAGAAAFETVGVVEVFEQHAPAAASGLRRIDHLFECGAIAAREVRIALGRRFDRVVAAVVEFACEGTARFAQPIALLPVAHDVAGIGQHLQRDGELVAAYIGSRVEQLARGHVGARVRTTRKPVALGATGGRAL